MLVVAFVLADLLLCVSCTKCNVVSEMSAERGDLLSFTINQSDFCETTLRKLEK